MTITKKNKILISCTSIIIILTGATAFYVTRSTPGLDSFVQLTKADPLFYSSFFDTQSFTSAVSHLEESERILKQSALKNLATSKESYAPSYTSLIENHSLFPTRFLKLLPALAQATDSFTAHPTAYKARTLLAKYTEAQRAYEKDIRSMNDAIATIKEHLPANRPLFYFFTGSATSLRVAEHDFNLIYKNSLALKQEIQDRSDCLAGKKTCSVPSTENIDSVDIAHMEPVAATGPNTQFIHDTLPFTEESRTLAGPYSIKSNCWGDSNAQPMYAIYSKKEGAVSILPKLANQNYYRLISPKATDKISKAVSDTGLLFYSQVEGTTYECSDLTFYPEILTLDFMHKNNAIPSYEYTQLWNNKFGQLAPALQALADYTNLLETSQRISNDFVVSPQFLFITRSAYSLTYLPFAKSVWRINENPDYLINQKEYQQLGAPQQFKTLTDLQKQDFSESAIKKSHINQYELINSLANQNQSK